jgi:hypothetical protein
MFEDEEIDVKDILWNKHQKREYIYYEKDFEITNLVKIKENGLYGIYTNDHKRLLFEIIYTDILPPNGLGYAVGVKNSKKGLLNIKTGLTIIPFEFDEIESLYYTEHFSFYQVELNGKVGIIDDKNNIIIPVIYDEIDIKKEIFNVRTDSSWKVYENGSEILPNFEIIERNGLFTKVKYKDNFGLLNNSNNQIEFPIIASSIQYKNNIYKITYHNSFGNKFEALLDNTLDYIITLKYYEIEFLSDVYYKVLKKYTDNQGGERGYGVIDNIGQIILKPEFEQIFLHDHGFVVRKVKEWKFINFQGEIIGVNIRKKDLIKSLSYLNNDVIKPKNTIINANSIPNKSLNQKSQLNPNHSTLEKAEKDLCEQRLQKFVKSFILLSKEFKNVNFNRLSYTIMPISNGVIGATTYSLALKNQEYLAEPLLEKLKEYNICIAKKNNLWSISDINNRLIFCFEEKIGKNKMLNKFEIILKSSSLKKRRPRIKRV